MLFRAAAPTLPKARVHWTWIWQAIALVVLMGWCYWRTLDGGFFWDDDLLFVANPLNRSLGGLSDVWFSTKPLDYYPMTYSAFWLEWQLWGNNPLGYHLVGFLLGLLNVFLLWALLSKLRLPGAWLAALWFGVHPVGFASVAWIAEGKNTASLAFGLGSLLAFVRGGGLTFERIPARWYALSLGLFVLAVLSKSSVVTLPCVLLLLIWWKRGSVTLASWLMLAPFFAVSLTAGLGTLWFHAHRAMGAEPWATLSLPSRICLAGRTTAFYLSKALWPVHLSMIYPRWETTAPSLLNFLPAGLIAAGLGLTWWGRVRWGRGPFTALACFVVSLLPVNGLIMASVFRDSFVFDHLMYLALAVATATAAAAVELWRRTPGGRRWAPVVAALATAGLVAGSHARAGDFASPENLWRATLAVNLRSCTAYNNLGLLCLKTGRLAEAETCFRAALRIDQHQLLALGNLASLLEREGRWPEASAAYARLLTQWPSAVLFVKYGEVWLELGDPARARTQFERAAKVDPKLLGAHLGLYRVALMQGDDLYAAEELDHCRRLDPDGASFLIAKAPQSLPPR